jgi:hypothetical protein
VDNAHAKQSRRLLFESDYGYESVEMFSLPDLKLKGVLTGIQGAAGMCSDAHGDVYVVTQLYPFAAVEISHAGKILRSVSDFYAYPAGCAVNPRNGDLAIGNIEGNSQPGMVSLFPGGASGYDRWLRCAVLSAYYFVGYDPRGDIFTDGVGKDGRFHLCRGRDTKDTLTEVKVTGTQINAPGMLEWYAAGKYLAVGDQHCTGSGTSCIYKVSISGDAGRVIGSTKPLKADGSPLCNLYQAAIEPGSGSLLGGDNTAGCVARGRHAHRPGRVQRRRKVLRLPRRRKTGQDDDRLHYSIRHRRQRAAEVAGDRTSVSGGSEPVCT